MNDPFNKGIGGVLKVIEEFARHKTLIDSLPKPLVAPDLMEQVARANIAFKAYEEYQIPSRLIEFTRSPNYIGSLASISAPSLSFRSDSYFDASQLVRPELAEIKRLSEFVSKSIPPFEGFLKSRSAWTSILSDRMATVNFGWALGTDPEASAEAFARLSRLSDVARFGRSYTEEVTKIIVDELGDVSFSPSNAEAAAEREERYDAAGRNRALIAFPPDSYGGILVSAGYAVSFPRPPKIAAEEGLQDPVGFCPEVELLLHSLEAHLRVYIQSKLHDLEGAAWLKRRVPPAIRDKWRESRDAAKAAGKPVYSPIYYANFMELFDVIVYGVNWKEFSLTFSNKDNLKLSLSRLYSIRNDVAHSRPISMSDQLMAVTEGTILFRSLGLPVTYKT